MLPDPLTKFEIQGCSVFKNLDVYFNIGNRRLVLYAPNNNVTYFDSFGFEHITKEVKAIKSIIVTNIFRLQHMIR